MKRLACISIIVLVGLFFSFDALMVFLLSGSLPIVDVTLPATTMMAIIPASLTLGLALKRRRTVYRHCLSIYDAVSELHEKTTKEKHAHKSKLFRRHYQGS